MCDCDANRVGKSELFEFPESLGCWLFRAFLDGRFVNVMSKDRSSKVDLASKHRFFATTTLNVIKPSKLIKIKLAEVSTSASSTPVEAVHKLLKHFFRFPSL